MAKIRKERVKVEREVLRSIHDYTYAEIVDLIRSDIILAMRNMANRPKREDIEVKLAQDPLIAATSGCMVISAAFDVDEPPEPKPVRDERA